MYAISIRSYLPSKTQPDLIPLKVLSVKLHTITGLACFAYVALSLVALLATQLAHSSVPLHTPFYPNAGRRIWSDGGSGIGDNREGRRYHGGDGWLAREITSLGFDDGWAMDLVAIDRTTDARTNGRRVGAGWVHSWDSGSGLGRLDGARHKLWPAYLRRYDAVKNLVEDCSCEAWTVLGQPIYQVSDE